MNQSADILQFWFEGIDDTTPIDKNKMPFKKWFTKDKGFDDELRRRFENDIAGARLGALSPKRDSPHLGTVPLRGRLALILLFDQFTRNIYRNTPKMFECDTFALDITKNFLSDHSDEKLNLIERVFIYMPLQHAEEQSIQKESLKCFENLLALAREKYPQNISYYEYTFNFAKRHHDIIARFGRFPHRNKILNRPSTKEEAEFLSKPGSLF